jgi:hypothetical protein
MQDDELAGNETAVMVVDKCPMTFDSILCWEETPANSYAVKKCPGWVIGFVNTEAEARRWCQSDGTWEKHPKNPNKTYTDYTLCFERNRDDKLLANHLPILKLIAKIGSILSLASLAFAILVLSCLK